MKGFKLGFTMAIGWYLGKAIFNGFNSGLDRGLENTCPKYAKWKRKNGYPVNNDNRKQENIIMGFRA